MSSWEREAAAEIEADQNKYFKEVRDDFIEQVGLESNDKEFINFLLIRMYYEGLPSKEPRTNQGVSK